MSKLRTHVAWLLVLVCLLCPAIAIGITEVTSTPMLATSDAATSSVAAVATGSAGDITAPTFAGLRATLIFVLFIMIAGAIAMRKLPAMLALPLMALGIGIIAGIPFKGDNGILLAILEGKTGGSGGPEGSFKLYKAIIWVLFGGIFARFISDAKIADRIVKYAAEYGGENPFNVSLLMSAITIMIFTAAGGLPMIIMLGTVMFPILLSLGVSAPVCGCILLMAFPIGSCLSPAEWARVSEVFSVPLVSVKQYFLTWAGIQVVVLVTFLSIEFMRMKRINLSGQSVAASLARFVGVGLLIGVLVFFDQFGKYVPAGAQQGFAVLVTGKALLGTMLQYATWIILVAGILITQYNYHVRKKESHGWMLLTPILPLIFLLGLDFGNAFIPAFMASLAYGVLTVPQPQALQRLGRSIINGVSDVAAPVMLMVGIGMLIAAATHERVDAILTPMLGKVIPSTPLTYVVFFFLASPLSLYRGPLNTFGLGVGVARLMQNFMPAAATMGALQSVSMLQDPTTTQNVWICGFLKLDINALLFKLFLYSIVLVILGLLLSVYLFFPGS